MAQRLAPGNAARKTLGIMEMKSTRRTFLGGAALGVSLPFETVAAFAEASPVFPADYRFRFTAEAAGQPAGQHWIAIERNRNAGRLLARSESRLLLPQRLRSGIPPEPLAFEHNVEETWVGGWLHGLVSDSRIGPARHRVRAWRKDGALRGTRDDRRFAISGYLMTASGWHRDTPRAEGLVDTVDGKLKRVRSLRRHPETVLTGWGTVEATRWTLVGEIVRELWYDAAGRLIRFALPAPSGLTVTATATEGT